MKQADMQTQTGANPTVEVEETNIAEELTSNEDAATEDNHNFEEMCAEQVPTEEQAPTAAPVNPQLTATNEPAPLVQQLTNLPHEILALPRFVKSGNNGNPKAPFGGWQKPKKQKLFSQLKGTCGFVPATEDENSLIFYDFDHVLDDSGEFVSEDARKWFNYLHTGKFYCELSQSGHGLHMFAAPTAGKFSKSNQRLNLSNGAMLEVFYRTNKFCLCTGTLFHCEPNAPIAKAEVAGCRRPISSYYFSYCRAEHQNETGEGESPAGEQPATAANRHRRPRPRLEYACRYPRCRTHPR